MALSTYADLKTSIQNWLHRSDLTSLIADWIVLCEADFNRRLRITLMEDRVTTDLAGEYLALPGDLLEVRTIQINTNPVAALRYLPPERMDAKYGGTSGQPVYYAMVGDEFQFAPVPDGTYEVEITYYARVPALSDDDPSNVILENFPDLYLYGSLIHSAPYIQNDQRIVLWRQEYERALVQIQINDRVKQSSGDTLQMVPG